MSALATASTRCLTLICTVLAFASLPLTPAAEADTVVIDDFALGAFSLQSVGGTATEYQLIGNKPHCIAAGRETNLWGANQGATAVLAPQGWNNKVELDFLNNGGQIFFVYETEVAGESPWDLTGGGVEQYVQVTLTDGLAGHTLRLTLIDGGGGSGEIHEITTWGPGEYRFDLSTWFLVDVTDITFLSVGLMVGAPGFPTHWEVADIRTVRFEASWLDFDLVLAELFCPPCPGPPIRFDVFNPFVLPADFVHGVDVSIVRATYGEDAAIQLLAAIPDTPFMENLGMELWWRDDSFQDTFFEFDVKLTPDESVPKLYQLPPVLMGSDSFVLTIPIVHEFNDGGVEGNSVEKMLFSIAGQQDLRFEDIQVYPTIPNRSSGEVEGFRVSFRLTGGSPDLGEPLFNVVWSGDWAPGTTPTDATIAPADVLGTGLSAWPSVTRAGTEFHLAQAAERSGMLGIFDVVGRRVRELQVPAGASRISWNGRDDAGVVTPGGVYFARYENGQETLVTRIVRLR